MTATNGAHIDLTRLVHPSDFQEVSSSSSTRDWQHKHERVPFTDQILLCTESNELPRKCQRNMSQLTRVHDLTYVLNGHRAKDDDAEQGMKKENDKKPLVTCSLHFASERELHVRDVQGQPQRRNAYEKIPLKEMTKREETSDV